MQGAEGSASRSPQSAPDPSWLQGQAPGDHRAKTQSHDGLGVWRQPQDWADGPSGKSYAWERHVSTELARTLFPPLLLE